MLLMTTAAAQEKFEREVRIDRQAVPSPALEFIAACEFDKKIKWYQEWSQEGLSYEAKSCKEDYLYSVEFDSLGRLLDVERKIDFKAIAAGARGRIEAELEAQFDRYKVQKVQEQFSGEEALVQGWIGGGEVPQGLRQRYEIVLKGRKGREKKYYEFLFDLDGQLLKTATIVDRPLDNIEF